MGFALVFSPHNAFSYLVKKHAAHWLVAVQLPLAPELTVSVLLSSEYWYCWKSFGMKVSIKYGGPLTQCEPVL